MNNPRYLAGQAMPAFETGNPPRQGFYEVQLIDTSIQIGEWREKDKQAGKIWWQYLSEHPTIAKVPVPLKQVAGWRKVEASLVEKHLKRELTLEELIDLSYTDFVRTRSLYTDNPSSSIPASRLLQIGDIIEFGGTGEGKVIALHEEGRTITVQYLSNSTNDESETKQYTLPIIRTGPWETMIRKADVRPTKLAVRPPQYLNYSNTGLAELIHRMQRCAVEDNPDYQRDYVWTLDDKNKFLESIFEARDIGRFVFVTYEYPKVDELFDGKQRLSTVRALIESKLPYKGIYWHQMSFSDRVAIKRLNVQFADLNGSVIPRSELLKIFLTVNAAGVPQTEAHLTHVKHLLELELQK